MRPIGFVRSVERKNCLTIYIEDATARILLNFLKAAETADIPPETRKAFLKARADLECARLYARDMKSAGKA